MPPTCPEGFEQGLFSSCYAKCPAEFKLVQDTANPNSRKCVHMLRNNRSFDLTAMALEASPQAYAAEQSRVTTEGERVKGEARADDISERDLNALQDQKQQRVQEYGRIQSDYAMYSAGNETVDTLKSITESLKPFRPPTSPSSDLEKERKGILDSQTINVFYVQIALFLVVLALVGYVVLPVDIAHGVAFLLLSVGISLGFFLRK